jgi:hypothetical protein
MLLEGNIESFTYFIMYDFTQLTSPDSLGKSLNILALVFAFLFFMAVLGGQFIVYFTEGKHSKHFLRGFKVGLPSIWFTTFHTGILNFCFGACHLLMQNHEENQLVILIVIEAAYVTFLTFSLRSNKIY